MPQISAVIVNYNSGQLLYSAVGSVLRSKRIVRVVVVDNGSADCSMENIQRLAEEDPRVVCIYNGRNMGFARACNIGISKSQSDYYLFLNPDCFLQPGSLEDLLFFITRRKRAAVAGPRLTNPDGSEQAGGRRAVPTPWRSFVRECGLSRLSNRYPRLFSNFYLHQHPLPDRPIEVEAISGSCMLVRREAMNEVGLWDEEYFLHCEDLDWCMRFRQKKWKILFVPTARVLHHKGVCSEGSPIFVEWHKHKGMMRFYRKFFRHQYPSGLMLFVAVGVWLRFGVMAGKHSLLRIKSSIAHNPG